MASNFYELNQVKLLLNIGVADTADDELLTQLGEVANTHVDNILKLHDERIPLKEPSILADVKMAANYYVCHLFRGKRGDVESAKLWKENFTDTINGVITKESFDGLSYTSHRFHDRFGQEDIFKLW